MGKQGREWCTNASGLVLGVTFPGEKKFCSGNLFESKFKPGPF